MAPRLGLTVRAARLRTVTLLLLSACTAPPPQARGAVTPPAFALPVESLDVLDGPVMGVDHDPDDYEGVEEAICLDYDGRGFPFCYDGHDGADFELAGGFDAMDAGSAWVVAGAPGEVIDVVDGYYDRCHLDPDTWGADCDGFEMRANRVTLRHASGFTFGYAHFMTDSIVVEAGDVVERGDRLGLIGSSGYSTAPHVHVEVQDPNGQTVDPYKGPYSRRDGDSLGSLWCEQEGPGGFPALDCD